VASDHLGADTSGVAGDMRSDERARRVSAARSQRAEAYRHSRLAHAVRVHMAEQEAAAAAEGAGNGAAEGSQLSLIVKADVQVRRAPPIICAAMVRYCDCLASLPAAQCQAIQGG
jgi:hypothetical protein